MPTVVVENPADGGFVYWLCKFYFFGALAALAVLLAIGFGTLLWLGKDVPRLQTFTSFRASTPLTTTARAWDGQPIGEFARERRSLIELKKVPPRLVQAFLAAEDRRFYRHSGIDVRGIMRAAWANLRAGSVQQGGSTITQQIAKAFLGPERTLTRKVREALLAARLEAKFSKDELLFFYLNTIFLGHGAYGVAAAAQRYFDTNLADLTLDQAALLAGLARAPTRYSPILHPERARARRDLVIDLMREEGVVTAAQAQTAKSRPLQVITQGRDLYRERAPYFAEYVRREVVRQLGERTFYEGGLTVETTADLHLQDLATDNVDFALRRLDKRQGWRGPVTNLPTLAQRTTFIERAAVEYSQGVADANRLYLALVEEIGKGPAKLRVGREVVWLPYSELAWAAPYSAKDSTNDLFASSIGGVLAAGDIVWVKAARGWKRAEGTTATVTLEQTPRIEGAALTFDHHTGYELAHVGGRDFDRSSFDRVSQACRQPGSTYKPIYYSLALDGTHAMNTVLHDKPYVPDPGEEWSPQNIHGTIDGRVTLWAALVRSLNLPSIQVLIQVGPQRTADWARRLGMTTPIHADKALALGASCTRLLEMGRAFAIFAQGGNWVDPTPIRRILDRSGHVLLDRSSPADPWLPGDAKLDRLAALTGQSPKQVIDPRTAYLTSRILRDAVLYGIAARAGTIGVPVAGKGGTSSDTMDVSFIGYTSQWLTAIWVGDDTYQRPLGAEDASYTIAIPAWARYMKDAIGTRPHKEIPWQRRPAGLTSIEVDPGSGEPVESGGFAVRMLLRKDLN